MVDEDKNPSHERYRADLHGNLVLNDSWYLGLAQLGIRSLESIKLNFLAVPAPNASL